MRTVAVVLAGGIGQRMGAGRPKQLIEVGGRTLLERSVAAFDAHPGVDAVLVVMAAGHEAAARELVAPHPAVLDVIAGGDTRTASTTAALAALADEPGDARVLFHDAARPFIPAAVIDRVLDALATNDAVAVGVPTSDTVVEVRDGYVAGMPPRDSLARFQTPQAFRLATIREAYRRASADPDLLATDDCGIVHRYAPEIPVRVVEGDERNLKVTHPLDAVLAEHLARKASS